MDLKSRNYMIILAVVAVAALACGIVALALGNRLKDNDVARRHLADNAVGPDELDESGNYVMNDLTLNGQLKEFRHNTENVSAVSNGTLAAPSRKLTADDSGRIFFVDISTYTYVAQLPTPAAGLNYTFILNSSSDAEGTVDFALYSGSSSIYIIGTGVEATTVVDTGLTNTVLQMDTSAAAANAGDRLSVASDGTNWYITDLRTVTANVVSGTALA